MPVTGKVPVVSAGQSDPCPTCYHLPPPARWALSPHGLPGPAGEEKLPLEVSAQSLERFLGKILQ